MLLKLYQAGQPILRECAKAVSRQKLATKLVQDVIDFMIATLRDAPGVGLAAPQVGESLQIIIIEDKASYHKTVPEKILKAADRHAVPLKILVNPKLEVVDAEPCLFFEGCLSVDGYTAAVLRHKSVRVTAWDRQGKPITHTATDWEARILQHEIDHLNGVLYSDKMLPKSFMSLKNFAMLWKEALPTKIARSF